MDSKISELVVGELTRSRNGQYKTQTADCRLQTADRVQNADYVQNADCRLQTGYKMQTKSK